MPFRFKLHDSFFLCLSLWLSVGQDNKSRRAGVRREENDTKSNHNYLIVRIVSEWKVFEDSVAGARSLGEKF